MDLFFFYISVFVISCSGAMQPGPVTATTISLGTKSRWAGLELALGHGLIEIPLIILIMSGLDIILKSDIAQVVIGLLGGMILIYMAYTMYIDTKKDQNPDKKSRMNNPVLAGIYLSASNPYFLIWWSTIGLNLAINARSYGIWAFAIFAVVHWLTDCVWLTVLSWASHKGTQLIGQQLHRIVLKICALALLGFGLYFIIDVCKLIF